MDPQKKSISLVITDLCINLSWTNAVTEDTAIEAVNTLCIQFINLYGGTYALFLDGEGIEMRLETVVVAEVSPVFVRIPDAKHQMAVEFAPTRDLSSLSFKQTPSYEIKPDGSLGPPRLYGNDNSAPYQVMKEEARGAQGEYTFSEVRQHNSKGDCWMILEGKVYDITNYIRSHPGGDIIMQAAGKDGSSLFRKHHPWVNAHALIGKLQIGNLIRR